MSNVGGHGVPASLPVVLWTLLLLFCLIIPFLKLESDEVTDIASRVCADPRTSLVVRPWSSGRRGTPAT